MYYLEKSNKLIEPPDDLTKEERREWEDFIKRERRHNHIIML